MRFIHSAFTTIVFKAVAMIAGLAVSVVIARALGPEGRGIYALIMTIIVMSASFGVFGLTASNTFFIARDPNNVRPIGLQSIMVGIIGTILCVITVLLLDYFSPSVLQGLNQKLIWLTLALVPLFLWGNLFSFAFLGRGKILAFNTFETTQRVIFLAAAVVFLVFWGSNLETYVSWVSVSVAILVGAYLIYYFTSSAKNTGNTGALFKPALAYGMKSYVATMLTLIVMRSGVFFVNYFNGNESSGHFAVAQQISELVIIVPTIVGTVLFGRISRGDSNHLTPMVVRTIAFIFLPITAALFVGSEWLTEFIFGSRFLDSVMLLKIMLPGAFLLGLEVVLAQDLAGRGYPWPAVLMWIPTVVINVVGYMLLIPKFGAAGAAVSVTISFALIFILILGYYIRITKTKLSALLIIQAEDITTLRLIVTGLLNGKSLKLNEGETSAVTAVSDQNKIKAQSVSG